MSSQHTHVSISSLPQTFEISDGDLLLIENKFNGTNVLDFKDLIIDQAHTTFQPLLSTYGTDISLNTTNLYTLSTILTAAMGIHASGDVTFPAGNVGIGNTTPRAPLDFREQNTGQVILLGENVNSNVRVGFGLDSANAGIRIFTTDASAGQAISFGRIAVSDGTTYSEDARFVDGKLGIGTDAPANLLHVKSSSSHSAIQLETDATNNYAYLSLRGGSSQWDIATRQDEYSEALQFRENGGTPSVVFAAGGNVGIGTTQPQTATHLAGVSACLTLDKLTTTPGDALSDSSNVRLYMKGTKLVIQYHTGITARYKYLELSDTSVAWTHSTTAP